MLTRLSICALALAPLGYFPNAHAQESTVQACSVNSPPSGCQGMWALRVKITAPNGAYVHVPDPGCMNDASGEIQKMMKSSIIYSMPQLALFSGPISKVLTPHVLEAFKSQGGDIGRYFSPYAKNGALCAPLIAVVPVDAEMVGYRFLVSEVNGALSQCSAGADCPVGWSKFQTSPMETRGTNMRTYNAIFMNWSHNRTRQAEMIIFYKLPAGKMPLQEI